MTTCYITHETLLKFKRICKYACKGLLNYRDRYPASPHTLKLFSFISLTTLYSVFSSMIHGRHPQPQCHSLRQQQPLFPNLLPPLLSILYNVEPYSNPSPTPNP